MNGHILVLTILAIALGAMVYVIGMPWLTPKHRQLSRRTAHRRTSHGHR